MTRADPDEVWRNFRALVVDRLDESRRQISEATGLPFSRVRALRRLRFGALTHAALAEATMVDRPAMTGTVDDLCARGLVVREAHPTDRRCKLVALTPAGRAMLARVDAVVPAPPPGWADAPAEDLAVLARLVDRVRAADPMPGPPVIADPVSVPSAAVRLASFSISE
ncbi:MAG TPA: MarR family transcriptional regulator [Pseudonocardia sp.]|nr:MarR family transcriptional regulator [Pseudonocardia sp.]